MKISRFVIIGFSVLSFSSCATICNERTVGVSIYTDVDSALVCIKDSDECYVTPVIINLLRSKSDVELIVKKDTITKYVTLKSQLSNAFMLDWLTPGLIGLAVDFTNPKMFSYPESNFVYLTPNDESNYFSLPPNDKYNRTYRIGLTPWSPSKKNQLYYKISIPEGNYFYLNKGNSYGDAFGFLGISVGVEYFFKDLYSINFDLGVMTDFIVPIPAPVDYFGSFESSSASYLDLQVGKDVQLFHFDLGLQGNRTCYYSYEEERFELFPEYPEIKKYTYRQYNAGLALSGYYKLSEGFCLGINYYPSCFSWHNGEFDFHYSHLMMFELIFRNKLFEPRRKTGK